jgi:hypothetical protein
MTNGSTILWQIIIRSFIIQINLKYDDDCKIGLEEIDEVAKLWQVLAWYSKGKETMLHWYYKSLHLRIYSE